MNKIICLSLTSITIIMILASYLFHNTLGLLYIGDISKEKILVTYVSELLSSGADDNMLIGLYDWFYVPIIILYLYNKCNITKFILGIYFFIVTMQLLSLLLLDVGSIYETIIYGKNFILLIWVLAYIFMLNLIIYILFKYKTFTKE